MIGKMGKQRNRDVHDDGDEDNEDAPMSLATLKDMFRKGSSALMIEPMPYDPKKGFDLDYIRVLAMINGSQKDIAGALCMTEKEFRYHIQTTPGLQAALHQGQAIGALNAKAVAYQQGVIKGKNGPLSLYLINTTDWAYAGRPQEDRDLTTGTDEQTTVSAMSQEELVKQLSAGIAALDKDMLHEVIQTAIKALPPAERAKITKTSVIPINGTTSSHKEESNLKAVVPIRTGEAVPETADFDKSENLN
jgi:hypothetical protein